MGSEMCIRDRTYTEGVLTVIKDDCTCGIQPDGTNAIVMIMSLDTTNITDMQLIEKDINMLDNLFMPDDIKINNSITVGLRAGVIGNSSSSFGYSCEASGHASHAEGSFTTATADYSHVEGLTNTASGECSHAEGSHTTASGNKSHAEGNNTTASGSPSHAEGAFTTASGECSHAEGSNTKASGTHSHAEGDNTIALGSRSHSEGDSTTASSPNQHVQGKYNIEDTEGKYAHIVGNGSDGNKSNAHTLDWEGNAWYAGTLSQDGTPTKDKDLITKKYLNDTLNDTIKKDIQDINTQLGEIANELGRDSEGNLVDMGTTATDIRSAIKELKDNQGNSGDGSSYTLPIATSTKLGGVKPVNKTDEMTQEIGVDAEGKLYTNPSTNGTGSTTTEDIATAESTFSASVIDLQKIASGSYKGNHNTLMFVATANTTLNVSSDDLLGDFGSYMISTAVVAPMENFTEEDGIITLTRNPNYTGTVAFMNGRCGFIVNLEEGKTYTFHVDNISCNFYLYGVESLPNSNNTLGSGDLLKSTIITGGSNIAYTFTPSKNYKFLRIACSSLPATITKATLVEGSVAGEYGGSKQTYSLKTGEVKYLKNIKNVNCFGVGDFYISPIAITEINGMKTEDGTIKTYATDKTFVNFGDSIWAFTTGEGSIGNLSDYMKHYCSGNWINLATGGTTMAQRPGSRAGEYDIFDFCNLADCVVNGDFSHQKAFTGATTNISNVDDVDWSKVDYITVGYGTNDLAFGTTVDNDSNLYDKATVCGALRYAIKTISNAYPKIKFKVLGIIYRYADGINNSTIIEWNKKIKDACEYMGAEYVDIRSLCGINEGNYSNYSYDGTHLKGAGKDAYAKGFASTIINI